MLPRNRRGQELFYSVRKRIIVLVSVLLLNKYSDKKAALEPKGFIWLTVSGQSIIEGNQGRNLKGNLLILSYSIT